jgi:hypothetical protein
LKNYRNQEEKKLKKDDIDGITSPNEVRGHTYREPKRRFETAGTISPAESYFVDRKEIISEEGEEIRSLIDNHRFFTIYAPRQTGKTTLINELCDKLNQGKNRIAIKLDFQGFASKDASQLPQVFRRFKRQFEEGIYEELLKKDTDKFDTFRESMESMEIANTEDFYEYLRTACRLLQDFQVTVFCDEVDGLRRIDLIPILSQLRMLYLQAKQNKLPQIFSVGLVGMRDVIELTGGDSSPFNIADRIKLRNFSMEETANLYAQYTEETYQPFTEDAVRLIHEKTDGQPFLVNRLGQILTRNIKPKTIEPITEYDVEKAIGILVEERNNHFDVLHSKFIENENLIARIIFDKPLKYSPENPELVRLELYGIIKVDSENNVAIANDVYYQRYNNYFIRNVGNQRLIDVLHDSYPSEEYSGADGAIKIEELILDFRRFLVEDGLAMFSRVEGEHEVLGQILFSGFIKHFCERNDIERSLEKLSGGGYIDTLLQKDGRSVIVEFMVWDGEKYYQEELRKLVFYLNTRREKEGYMVIFRYYNARRRENIDFYPEPKEEEIDGKKIKAFELYVPGKI